MFTSRSRPTKGDKHASPGKVSAEVGDSPDIKMENFLTLLALKKILDRLK